MTSVEVSGEIGRSLWVFKEAQLSCWDVLENEDRLTFRVMQMMSSNKAQQA